MRPIAALLTLLSLAIPFNCAFAAGASLRVTVENLKNDTGQIVIAIFASEQDFLTKSVDDATIAIREDLSGEVEFNDLPAGRYAVAVYHDKNANGILDKTLGVPNEAYGFSNNARGVFGPPNFDSAAVNLAVAEHIHITITAK